MKFQITNRGETLLEAIIAVAILILVITPASALNVASIRNIAVNRNDLIAGTLAQEGIEMVRKMRDTNLLRFAANADTCWDTMPDTASSDNCAAAKMGNSPYYRLEFNPDTFVWGLAADTFNKSLSSDLSGIGGAGGGDDDFYQVYFDNTGTQMYFRSSTVSRGQATAFYREVAIAGVDLDTTDGVSRDALQITSRVVYRVGGAVRQLRLVSLLTRP